MIHFKVSRTLTNFGLDSNNFIRLIGVNLDGAVDENADEEDGVVNDHSNLFVAKIKFIRIKEHL